MKFEEQHDKLRNEYWEEVKSHSYVKSNYLCQVEDVDVQQHANLLELEQSLSTKSAAGISRGSTVEQQHLKASLPRIQVPPFSGKFEDWPTFRDLFTSLIIGSTTEPPTYEHLFKFLEHKLHTL